MDIEKVMLNITTESWTAIANAAQALSVAIAVGFGIYGFLQSNRRLRADYTMHLIQFKFEDNDIFRAYDYISGLISDNQLYNPDVAPSDIPVAVEKLLSYFELVSIAFHDKICDRKIIKLQIRSGMRDTYIVCQPYIADRRARLRRPKLYDNYRRLAFIFCDTQDQRDKCER